jgi:hypothetical protein
MVSTNEDTNFAELSLVIIILAYLLSQEAISLRQSKESLIKVSFSLSVTLIID